MDFYESLNVSRDASPEAIKKSYRKLVKIHHPDKTGGDDIKFKQISEAYETLSDPAKRGQYDNTSNLDAHRHAEQSSSWDAVFNSFGGDFVNMFDHSFSGEARGHDIRVVIEISIEESYMGTKRYIDVGTGGFNINIPRGILNGTKLKVPGRGTKHPINSSAPSGDMILNVNVNPDSDFIVNGSDIYIELHLNWIDMILGGEFEVRTKVNSVKIKVPQGSYDGKMLRVVGMGMPIYNQEGYGNLMVKLRTLAINLTEEQIEILKKIKNSNG